MKRHIFNTLFLILIFSTVGDALIANAAISIKSFKHHFVTCDLPGDYVMGIGTPAMADFDRDGDLDFAFCSREDSFYWFEKQDSTRWIMHVVGEIHLGTLGAVVMDVDKDKWPDIVIGGYWYRNTHNPCFEKFECFRFDDTIQKGIHDIVTADVNNDGQAEVVLTSDGFGCYWYTIPENPKDNFNWQKITITLDVLDENDDIHGGFAPNGVNDLDGDGDMDVVLPDRWLENQDNGKIWIKHGLPFGKRGPWGLSSRSWIADLDKDGDHDIVIVDADQQGSRGAWLENDGATPPEFTTHFLPKTADGTRGSFHSLALADFDNDGDLDIFTVEQEDISILPVGASPRGYIWENLDGKSKEFAERIIFDESLGGHDALAADVDGDGDIDIYFKNWYNLLQNGNGGKEHADFLENLLINGTSDK
ncbi:VCBS repeat-containing protein [candidate division KSB1 bacterium]|nr:VCBS repeat-containing protein [candidate division KSB1 bacterium]